MRRAGAGPPRTLPTCSTLSVPAVNSALQRARGSGSASVCRLTQATVARQRGCQRGRAHDLLKKYVEASDRRTFGAFASIIRADATFRMPPEPGTAAGREAMFKLMD